ncbi:MAG: glycosyltransferase [candidate division KSB1 bacterium]|nr:glycosyltransferase [candidate division KSB1 bacterium]
MKIVHVVHDFVPGVGGFQIAVFEIARRQARTHEVEVYSGYPNGRSVKKEIMDNIKVFRFPSYAPNNAYHISFPLYQALKDVEGDILHIYCFLTAIPFLAYLALRQAKNKFKKIIFTPGVQVATTPFRIFLHKLYDPVQKRLFFWADKIICWTEHEKSLIQRQFKVPPTKMHVIPLGLDETKFT